MFIVDYLASCSRKWISILNAFGIIIIASGSNFAHAQAVLTTTWIAGEPIQSLLDQLEIREQEDLTGENINQLLELIERNIQGEDQYNSENRRFRLANQEEIPNYGFVNTDLQIVLDDNEVHQPLSMLLSSIESILLMQQIFTEVRTEYPDGDKKTIGNIVADKLIKTFGGNVHSKCEEAFLKRVELFREGVGNDPVNFGMIKQDDVKPVSGNVVDGGIWSGSMELCTWIGAKDNYFYDFDFTADVHAKSTPMTLLGIDVKGNQIVSSNNISSVITILDGVNAMIRNENVPGRTILNAIKTTPWRWKLHANGDNILVNKVSMLTKIADNEDEEDWPDIDLDHNCFDVFFKDVPNSSNGASFFKDLSGYCSGRCEDKVVNSVG